MSLVKFVERDTFQQVGRIIDLASVDLLISSVIPIGRAYWRVVGSAPHPNRLDDVLVFVELYLDQPSLPSALPERRSLGLSNPALADDWPWELISPR